MSRQVLFRSPPVNRRQPLLTDKPLSPMGTKKGRCGEVAGGTAAECAAVCCCCPCGLMNLLILAVYKVPTGLCRKMWSKSKKTKRQRMMKNKGLLDQQRSNANTVDGHTEVPTAEIKDGVVVKEEDGTTEAVALEKDMYVRFYGTGFWRSPSQRDS